MSNLSKLRAAARAAKVPAEDAAAVALAAELAEVLDMAGTMTLADIAAGRRQLGLEDRLEVLRIVGPQYLRTLTALGLTRAGRGVGPAATIPTSGSAAGASQDAAAHAAHRQRFSERSTG